MRITLPALCALTLLAGSALTLGACAAPDPRQADTTASQAPSGPAPGTMTTRMGGDFTGGFVYRSR
jgi:hypothetical protein